MPEIIQVPVQVPMYITYPQNFNAGSQSPTASTALPIFTQTYTNPITISATPSSPQESPSLEQLADIQTQTIFTNGKDFRDHHIKEKQQ